MGKLVEPKDIAPTVADIARQYGENWLSMADVWQLMQVQYPQEAEQVREKVDSYADPVRNNERWFLYWASYQAEQHHADIELSNVDEQPDADVADKAFGLIRKAR